MVSRSFVRAVREDTLRGSEGHATFAAIEKCKLEEAFGEAARGYASATSLWLARLDGVVGDQSDADLGELVSACERTSVQYKHAGELGKCAKESERICRLILSNIRVI